ncbi:MAG: hypothetical protein KGI08_09770 [Thaumarchaeota archaeon]|nr:hypothetical protein [Nitrososphaerota archaeon]
MKSYSAWFLRKGEVGSVISNDYPNKKDMLIDISKAIDDYGSIDVRIEVRK